MAEYGEPLTERELEIVRLVATGAANKEIAAKLYISPNTVRVHLRNIFTKLGAQSRTEVSMIAVRNGWVDIGAVVLQPEQEAASAQPSQTIEAPRVERVVLVAPDPLPPPPLPLWRRALLVAGSIFAALLSVWLWFPAPERTTRTLAENVALETSARTSSEAQNSAEPSRWHARAAMRSARVRSAVAFAEGNIFVIGGEVDGRSSAEVLIYNAQQDVWRVGTPKPTAVTGAAAAVLGRQVFVVGGTTEAGKPTQQVEVLDLDAQAWRSAPPLPVPLTGHAVAASKDKLFVLGGRTDMGLSQAVFALDTQAQRWSALPALKAPRSALAAVVVDHRLFALGGFDGRRELATCEQLDLNAPLTWQPCAPMITPRAGHGAAAIGRRIFVVGGGLSGFVGFSERYDVDENRWTSFEMPLTRLGEWRYVGVVASPTTLYALGGAMRGVPLADTYAYEVLTFRTFLPAFQAGKPITP
ncbi:MAG: LuxR C-terminal-related transcriptional regulator [Anaerolineae bacterium]|nr:LuxR C-terminal-related transcriptional regulator [Anaerolineae bacterium]